MSPRFGPILRSTFGVLAVGRAADLKPPVSLPISGFDKGIDLDSPSLTQIWNQCSDAMLMVDAAGCLLSQNQAAQRAWQLVPGQSLAGQLPELALVLEAPQLPEGERHCVTLSGHGPGRGLRLVWRCAADHPGPQGPRRGAEAAKDPRGQRAAAGLHHPADQGGDLGAGSEHQRADLEPGDLPHPRRGAGAGPLPRGGGPLLHPQGARVGRRSTRMARRCASRAPSRTSPRTASSAWSSTKPWRSLKSLSASSTQRAPWSVPRTGKAGSCV